eukprot:Sdes_comp18185_c0_seq2m7709
MYGEYEALKKEIKNLQRAREENSDKFLKGFSSLEEKNNIILTGKRLKQETIEKEILFASMDSTLYRNASHFPNRTHPDVPIGLEETSKVIQEVTPPSFPVFCFPPKDHLQLG